MILELPLEILICLFVWLCLFVGTLGYLIHLGVVAAIQRLPTHGPLKKEDDADVLQNIASATRPNSGCLQ